MALVASDHLIVPLKPEDYGAQGIIDVQESVDLVLSGPNPSLKPLGYLLTLMNARKTIHKLYEETLRAQFGPQVFETRITEVVDYVEALNQRLPVAQYKPKRRRGQDHEGSVRRTGCKAQGSPRRGRLRVTLRRPRGGRLKWGSLRGSG